MPAAARDDGARAPLNTASIVRKVLLWWFRAPWGQSHVSANIAVEMSPALAYLDALNERDPEAPKVTIQHLLAGAVGRTLGAFPAANARIVAQRIVPSEHVGLAMPVNLVGSEQGKTSELGMALLEQAECLSLRQIASRTRKAVAGERSGRSTNRFMRSLKSLAASLPQPMLEGLLEGLHRASQNPVLAERLHAAYPATAGLTNPGAALGEVEGARVLGGAFQIPQKLVHVGTLWGVSPIHQDVVVIGGKPVVGPVLPVLLVFDHRLIDGVMAGRMLVHFVRILRDPAACFGAEGHRPGGDDG